MKREFYLQDSRSLQGNSMCWWAKDGGHTTDLCEAKTYSRDEAQAWHNIHPYAIPWPIAYIHASSRLVVDRQDVRVALLEQMGLDLHLEPRPPLEKITCPCCGHST